MSEIWVTSDFHFGHDKEFIWKERGFSSLEEMNEALIENFNSRVKEKDIAYILGDCIMGFHLEEGIEKLKKLNGKLTLVAGNHDTEKKIELFRKENIFENILFADRIKIGKFSILLSHYPTIVTNTTKDKIVNFHGHTHSKSKFSEFNCCYHIGVDANNNYPVSLEESLEKFRRHSRKVGI